MCLFFKQSEGSTGADDSNFGPKQGGGNSEKTLRKLPNKKSKQTLAGFNDRGAGWNTVRQQVLYFAEFVINALNKYSSLFKTVFILLQHFLYYPPYSEMNGKNKLHVHVFGQIFGLKIDCGSLM